MTQSVRLGLFAVALLGVMPPALRAQPVGSQHAPANPPRRSHVPIEGSIPADFADMFLRDRREQAETMAGLQRLLTDLAEHPERHGIDTPQDQKALQRALRNVGGQPEKLLQDREVRRIITEAAGKELNRSDATEEERRRWEELARRFLPPEVGPLDPDLWQPGEKPDDPREPSPIGPKPALGGAGTPRPPEPGPGSQPAPPPPPATQPADSPIKDHLRDMARALADSRLAESPAFRRLVANIDRVKEPEADAADWTRRWTSWKRVLPGWGSVCRKSPGRRASAPRDSVGPIGPAASDPGESAREGRQLLLVLLAAATAGLCAWGLLRRKGLLVRQRGDGGWRFGPWPVRPEAVRTRDELVRAFEYLALLLLGPAARSRNHREIAAGLGDGRRGPPAPPSASPACTNRRATPRRTRRCPTPTWPPPAPTSAFLAGVAAA